MREQPLRALTSCFSSLSRVPRSHHALFVAGSASVTASASAYDPVEGTSIFRNAAVETLQAD
jgi:hypothetical protein